MSELATQFQPKPSGTLLTNLLRPGLKIGIYSNGDGGVLIDYDLHYQRAIIILSGQQIAMPEADVSADAEPDFLRKAHDMLKQIPARDPETIIMRLIAMSTLTNLDPKQKEEIEADSDILLGPVMQSRMSHAWDLLAWRQINFTELPIDDQLDYVAAYILSEFGFALDMPRGSNSKLKFIKVDNIKMKAPFPGTNLTWGYNA